MNRPIRKHSTYCFIQCATLFLCALLGSNCIAQSAYKQILIDPSAHPAIKSAAALIAKQLGLPADTGIKTIADPGAPGAGEILLVCAPASPAVTRLLGEQVNLIQHDGYLVAFSNGGIIIYGARPRSLLYAAGDLSLWQNKSGNTIVRNPSFAIRSAGFDSHRTVAENVAEYGVNVLLQRSDTKAVSLKQTLPEVYAKLGSADQQSLDAARDRRLLLARQFTQQCHDADVEMYTFLYGNNFQTCSPSLYDAALAAYPSVKGVSEPGSWEQGVMCPADPLTWKFVQAFIRDVMDTTQADGLYVTFWDEYGINSKDPRSVAAGMDKFPNQLYACVKAYHDAVQPLGKKLVIRTWSSGVAHWLGDKYVHGLGDYNFGGSALDLWSRVINELPADIILQDKVYASDCQPDSRFNPMIGHVQPHIEIAEY